MIFCPNECIGAGSGEGEGWRSMRDTRHAARTRRSRLPALQIRVQNFLEGNFPYVRTAANLFKCRTNSLGISNTEDQYIDEVEHLSYLLSSWKDLNCHLKFYKRATMRSLAAVKRYRCGKLSVKLALTLRLDNRQNRLRGAECSKWERAER